VSVCLSPYCFIIIVRLMPIYKVYTIGRNWSGPVMSAAACFLWNDNSICMIKKYTSWQNFFLVIYYIYIICHIIITAATKIIHTTTPPPSPSASLLFYVYYLWFWFRDCNYDDHHISPSFTTITNHLITLTWSIEAQSSTATTTKHTSGLYVPNWFSTCSSK